jgi:hypothetical protein
MTLEELKNKNETYWIYKEVDGQFIPDGRVINSNDALNVEVETLIRQKYKLGDELQTYRCTFECRLKNIPPEENYEDFNTYNQYVKDCKKIKADKQAQYLEWLNDCHQVQHGEELIWVQNEH